MNFNKTLQLSNPFFFVGGEPVEISFEDTSAKRCLYPFTAWCPLQG